MGSPLHWAVQGAVFGGVVGCLVVPYLLIVDIPLFFREIALLGWLPTLLEPGVVGAGVGGAIGSLQPALLDRVRGRVPLPVLAAAQGMVGAAAGVLSATVLTVWMGGPNCHPAEFHRDVLPMWPVAAAVGGVTTALAWLPITLAMVLRVRTWPLTLVLAAGLPSALLVLVRTGVLPPASILLGL